MDKLAISLRYYLIGCKYFQALKAMEFAAKFHTGTRKDGKTPEFSHQMLIVQYLRTLHSGLLEPEDTFSCGFLHDTPEDYDVGFDEIENKFGVRVTKSVRLVTKKYRGTTVPEQYYYEQIGEDSIASVVKGGDRNQNVSSMVGVFTREKQLSYVEETEKLTLPMLKKARRNFPEQESVYENEKLLLNSQIALIRKINEVQL
jgi:(p)ppGpp synthase/HD superfamily hydrolase